MVYLYHKGLPCRVLSCDGDTMEVSADKAMDIIRFDPWPHSGVFHLLFKHIHIHLINKFWYIQVGYVQYVWVQFLGATKTHWAPMPTRQWTSFVKWRIINCDTILSSPFSVYCNEYNTFFNSGQLCRVSVNCLAATRTQWKLMLIRQWMSLVKLRTGLLLMWRQLATWLVSDIAIVNFYHQRSIMKMSFL